MGAAPVTARITGWAPDPHDAEPPEDEAPICERCDGDAEDGVDVELSEEEVSIGGRMPLRHLLGRPVRLCDRCNEVRKGCWSLNAWDEQLEAITVAAGLSEELHPSLRAARIIEILQKAGGG